MTNLQHERIAGLCAELHLKAVESAWPAAAQAAVVKEATFGDFLEDVLRTEAEARRVRAREMAAHVAGFPAIKTLEGYDFGFAFQELLAGRTGLASLDQDRFTAFRLHTT